MEYIDPLQRVDRIATRNQAMLVHTVARRADLLATKSAIDAASLDAYEFTRDLYLEHRRAQIYGGPPPDQE